MIPRWQIKQEQQFSSALPLDATKGLSRTRGLGALLVISLAVPLLQPMLLGALCVCSFRGSLHVAPRLLR